MSHRPQRFWAIALVSLVISLLGSFLSPGAFLNRLLAIVLCSLLGFQSNACIAQQARASDRAVAADVPTVLSSKTESYETKEKGLLDGIFKVIKGQQVCLIPGLCLNTSDLTEALLAKQIRELAEKNAPITVSSNNLFQTVNLLPGEPFNPSLLDLRDAKPDDVIPVGDYVLPVKFYCLQKPAGSPPGHRYVLGQYGGKRKEALAALGRATIKSNASYNELQALSWAVQAGVAYDDMPQEMQALVDTLIPEQRSSLQRGWLEDLEKIWNTGSPILNLPSFDSFLSNRLGEAGKGIVAFREVKSRLVNRGRDWRNLSDIFIIDNGSQGAGNILETPWSQLGENVYARFITEGNAGSTGLLLLRLGEAETQKTKFLPLVFAAIEAGLTIAALYDLTTTLVALPEGNQNIQPGQLLLDFAALVPGVGLAGKAAKLLRRGEKAELATAKALSKKELGASSASRNGNLTSPTIGLNKLPSEAQSTIIRIKNGGPFPYKKDGTEFINREGILPKKSLGYYKEYTVETPGATNRGAQRIVTGQDGEMYYTNDHYGSFLKIK